MGKRIGPPPPISERSKSCGAIRSDRCVGSNRCVGSLATFLMGKYNGLQHNIIVRDDLISLCVRRDSAHGPWFLSGGKMKAVSSGSPHTPPSGGMSDGHRILTGDVHASV